MTKVNIRIADILKGKVDLKASKIIIPFNTSNSDFPKTWKNIPRNASLVFLLRKSANGKLEYIFRGVDLICPCKDCVKKRK